MRTRSKPSKGAAAADTALTEPTPKPLPLTDSNPPKLFVLPNSLSKDARIVTLAHPRTLTPTRYYHCPQTGIHEIKRIAPPASAHRSLLLTPHQSSRDEKGAPDDKDEQNGLEPSRSEGYVCKSASFFAVTPMDPLFLVLPALSPKAKSTGTKSDEKVLFLSADDLLEQLFDQSKHLQHLIRHERTRDSFESRMAVICDTVDAGDEKMYRLNNSKLLQELTCKAERMSEGGLPPSLEEKFVKKALAVPMVSLLVEEEESRQQKEEMLSDSVPPIVGPVESLDSQSTETSVTRTESQSSISTASTSITIPTPLESQTSTASTTASSLQPTEEIIHLLRLRTALSYLFSSYIPAYLASTLESLLDDPETSTPIDFTPLTKHLAALAALRAENAARNSIRQGAGESRKRGFEDEEDTQSREERKRRKEEEEKRKKLGESRGIRDLKKVDTKGMKKMSDFFRKK